MDSKNNVSEIQGLNQGTDAEIQAQQCFFTTLNIFIFFYLQFLIIVQNFKTIIGAEFTSKLKQLLDLNCCKNAIFCSQMRVCPIVFFYNIKGALTQIRKPSYMFVLIQKQYPENFAFLMLRILELSAREVCKFLKKQAHF